MNVKFGALMGANLAVACVLMQGCKAPQAGASSAEPAPVEVAPAQPAPAAQPAEPVAAKPAEPKPVEAEPVAPAPKPVVAEPETTTYVVRRGDYLAKICKTYNIKQSAVLKANPGLDANKIRVGQKIKLPGKVEILPEAKAEKVVPAKKPASKPAEKSAKAAYAPYTGATKEYVVKNGDMLGSIAQAYGISIRALKELNGLDAGPKGNALKVNQKLKVPAEKVVAAAPVKKADAPAEKKAEAVAPAPAAAAPAAAAPAPEAAPAAQPAEAAVPEAEPAPEAAQPTADSTVQQAAELQAGLEQQKPAEAAPAAPAPAAPKTHTVTEGQDLIAIAIKYAVSPTQILDENNLAGADAVKPGMVLKLPAGAKVQ